jgi:dienelactone hydrolase
MRTNNDPTPLVFDDSSAAGLDLRFYRTYTNHFLTFYPPPTGPFSVGTVDRVLIDPARTGLYRFSPHTNAFMASLWYPADAPPAGTLPKHAIDHLFATDSTFETYVGLDVQWTNIFAAVVQESFANIPLAASPATFPVVLISHGLSAYRQAFTLQAAELASHGYVVIAVDHPDCWACEFPDGRYLYGARNADVTGRLLDMAFLVNELTAWNNSDPFFGGRLDLGNVGVFGHSAGGMVIDTCRTNVAVKCAAIYDGVLFSGLALQKPMLIMLGQTNGNFSVDQTLFSKATNNVAVFLQIRGADHITCADGGWGVELPWGRSPNRAVSDSLLWFFDSYLKSETPAFPTNSEIYNVQRK